MVAMNTGGLYYAHDLGVVDRVEIPPPKQINK